MNKRTRAVVFTGAGISAESGLKTFRGEGGLWEGVPVQEVATPEAWRKDFKRVLRFYDERRKAVAAASPNAAHHALVTLENHFDTTIITQNIDDLHERAGSSRVLHLHGEITKARSSVDPSLIYPLSSLEIPVGATCTLGSQLRPHIVWFGEAVPEMERAIEITQSADIFIVIGSSLEVYPAASLLDYVQPGRLIFLIDPNPVRACGAALKVIAKPATVGTPKLVEELISRIRQRSPNE
jgi:NAD-dependent deacetylase